MDRDIRARHLRHERDLVVIRTTVTETYTRGGQVTGSVYEYEFLGGTRMRVTEHAGQESREEWLWPAGDNHSIVIAHTAGELRQQVAVSEGEYADVLRLIPVYGSDFPLTEINLRKSRGARGAVIGPGAWAAICSRFAGVSSLSHGQDVLHEAAAAEDPRAHLLALLEEEEEIA